MFTAAERLQGWRASMLDGAFHAIYAAMAVGPFLPAFALMLGATPFELGVLSAITQLAMVGGAGLDRLPIARKPMAMWAAAGARYLWMPMAALPFLSLGGFRTITIFLLMYAVSALLMQAAGLAWLDWIGDLVEADRRGRYFAWRNAMMTGLTMLCAAAAGPWLDLNRRHGQEAIGFLGILLVAVLAGVACRWTIVWQPDTTERQRALDTAREPMTPAWRSFLLFIAVWLLVASLAGPFYTAYALQSLHMSYQDVATWSLIGSLTGMLSQPLLGRHLDRGRRGITMVISAACIAILPALWLVASPARHWPIWLDGIGNGIVWTAFSLCQMHVVLQVCPKGGRRQHLGNYTAVNGLASGVSALIGGWLIERHWALPYQGAKLLFVLTCVGRAACVLWLVFLVRKWRDDPAVVPTAIPEAVAT